MRAPTARSARSTCREWPTLTIGLAALVLALVESNSWGWGSQRMIVLYAIAAIAFVSFVTIERHRRAPMIDFEVFRSRSFFGANVVAFIVSFAMLAMFFFLALYMQDILHYTPIQAGLRFLPSTILVMIAGPIAGRLADRVGSRPLMTIGLLLVSFSMFWMTGITTHASYAFLLVPFMTMGVGIGLVMSPMSTAAMNAVDQSKAGVASGILSMVRMVGGTFGVAVMGAIIATLGRERLTSLLPQASSAQRDKLVDALGSGASNSSLPSGVQDALSHTYVYALSNALFVAGGLALVGAALAWLLVSARQPATREQSASAEPLPAA